MNAASLSRAAIATRPPTAPTRSTGTSADRSQPMLPSINAILNEKRPPCTRRAPLSESGGRRRAAWDPLLLAGLVRVAGRTGVGVVLVTTSEPGAVLRVRRTAVAVAAAR